MKLAEREAVQDAALGNPAFTELAHRFIAGDDPGQVVACAEQQNSYGLLGLPALVGSLTPDAPLADDNVDAILNVIDRLRPSRELNEISLLPALFGLADGIAAARPRLTTLVRAASDAGVKVTLDMGPVDQIDATLQLFAELRANAPTLGIALQTRLLRTKDDVRALAPLGARVRLCAGAFPVSSGEGVSSRQQSDLAFVTCLRTLMESPSYPMVATHDKRLIPIAEELADRSGRTVEEYEFQMLYGFRTLEQRRLADTGHRSRVYLPFGRDWYDYISRRVAARPFSWLRTLWTSR